MDAFTSSEDAPSSGLDQDMSDAPHPQPAPTSEHPSRASGQADQSPCEAAARLVVDACARARRACEGAAAASRSAGRARYLLHSVLTHSGTVNSGHYYAYVRPGLGLDMPHDSFGGAAAPSHAAVASVQPSGSAAAPPALDPAWRLLPRGSGIPIDVPRDRFTRGSPLDDGMPCDHRPSVRRGGWYKFDDSSVSAVSASEAVEENFGSGASSGGHGRNAYYLVYVREDALSDLMLAGCHPLLFAPGCKHAGPGELWTAADGPSIPRSRPLTAFPDAQPVSTAQSSSPIAVSEDEENMTGSPVPKSDQRRAAEQTLGSPRHPLSLGRGAVDLSGDDCGTATADLTLAENANQRQQRANMSASRGPLAAMERLLDKGHPLGSIVTRQRPPATASAARDSHADAGLSAASDIPSSAAIGVIGPVLHLAISVPLPSDVLRRVQVSLELLLLHVWSAHYDFAVQLADAREVEERKARLASEHAARLKTFAMFHVVSEAHQACAPVPQADEKQSGTSIDALPLAHAFRCALRLSDTPDALYNAVRVRLCSDFLAAILNYMSPHMQTALSLPPGSFVLWGARHRDECHPGLRPAMMWPGCPWLHDVIPLAADVDDSEPFVQVRPRFMSLALFRNTSVYIAFQIVASPRTIYSIIAAEKLDLHVNLRTTDGPDVARWVPECMDPAHSPPSTLSSGRLYNDDSEDSLRLRQWYAGGAWKLQPLHPWQRFYSGVLGDDLPSEASSAEPNARKPETLWSTVMQPDIADGVTWRTLPVSVEVVIFLQLLPVGPMHSISPAPGNALWHAMHPAIVRCLKNNAAWISHLAASLEFEPKRFPAALSDTITAESKGDVSPCLGSTDTLLVMGAEAVAESLARWTANVSSVATQELSLPSIYAPFSRLLLRHITDGGSRVGPEFAETDFVPIHVYRYSTVLTAPGEPAVNPQLLESPCIPRIALSHPHHGASVAFVGTVIVPAGLCSSHLNILLARWLGLAPPAPAAIAKLGESRDVLCQAMWGTVSDSCTSSVKSALTVTELQKPAPDGRKKGASRLGSIIGTNEEVDCFAAGDVLWVEYDDANVLRWWSAALQQLSDSTHRGRVGSALAKAAGRDTGLAWAPRELCNPLSIASNSTSADDFVRALKPAAHTCFSLRGASLDAPGLFRRGNDESSSEDGNATSSLPLPLVLPCSISRFVVVPVASASPPLGYDWLSQPWRDMAEAVARFLDAYLQRCSRDVEAADSVHFEGGAFNLRDVLRAFTEGVPAGPPSEGPIAVGHRGSIPALFLPFEASLDRMLFLPDVATAIAQELNRRLLLICAGLLMRRMSLMPRLGEAATSVAMAVNDIGSSHKRARRAGAESTGPVKNAYEAEVTALEHNPRVRLPPECTIRASHIGFYAPEPAYSLRGIGREWSFVKSVRNLHGATRDSRGALDPFSLRPPPLFGSANRVQLAEQWLFEPRHLAFDLLSLGDSEIESAVAVQCYWVGGAGSDAVRSPSRSFVLRAGANVAYDEIVRRVRVEIGANSSTADAASPTALRISAYSLIYAQVALALESSETSDSLQEVASARESFVSVGSSPETEARPAAAATSGFKTNALPPFCRPALVCVLDKSSTLGGVVLLAGKMALARTLQETSSRYFRDDDGALVAKYKPRVLQLILVAEPVSHDEPEFPNLLGSSKPVATPAASDACDSTGASKRLRKSPQMPPPPRILPSRAARSHAAKLSSAVDMVTDDDEEGNASASDASVVQSSRGVSKRANAGRSRKPSGATKAPNSVILPPPGAHRVWIAVSVALPRHRPNLSAVVTASRPSGPPILAGRTALVCVSREDTLGGVLRKAAAGLGLSSTDAVISPESFGLDPDAALPPTSEARRAMRDLLQPWPDCEIVRSTPARAESRSGLARNDGDADAPLASDPFNYNSDSETKAPSTSTRAKRSKASSTALPKGDVDDTKYMKRLIKIGAQQQTTLNFATVGGMQRPKPGVNSDDVWDAVQRDADQQTPSRNAVNNTSYGRGKVGGAPVGVDLTSDNEDDADLMRAVAASKAAEAEDASIAAATMASLRSATEVSSLAREAEPLLRGRDRQPHQTSPSPAAQKLPSSTVDLVSDDSDAIAPTARPASSSTSKSAAAAKGEGRQRTGSCSSVEGGRVESRQPAATSAAAHVAVGLVQKPAASCTAATPFDVQSLGRCEPLMSSPAAPARKKDWGVVSICGSDGDSDEDECPAVTASASMPPPPLVSLRWSLRVCAGMATHGGSTIGLQVYALPLLLIRPRPATPPTQGGVLLQGQLARLSAGGSHPPGGLDMDCAAVGTKRGRAAAVGPPGAPPLPPRPLTPSEVVRAAWRLAEGITGGQALVAPGAPALLPMRVSDSGADAAAVLQCSLAPSESTVRAALRARQLQSDDDGDAGQRSTSPIDIDAKAGSSGAASGAGKKQASMSAFLSGSSSRPPAGGGKGRGGGGGGGIVIS